MTEQEKDLAYIKKLTYMMGAAVIFGSILGFCLSRLIWVFILN